MNSNKPSLLYDQVMFLSPFYYPIIKELWDELNSLQPVEPCVCGNAKSMNQLQQLDRTMEFLQGFRDRYIATRSQSSLIDHFPNVDKIYSLVRQKEKQKDLHALGGPPEAAALATQNKQPLL